MNLPSEFIERSKPLLKEEWNAFAAALNSDIPTSIRLNRKKTKILKQPYTPVVWGERGYYLDRRPQFTFDPLFHAGHYYVQEASSMFVEQAIKQYIGNEKVRFLDLCAAPGGKSTLVADTLSNDSLLVSNEVIRSRANILSENVTKWGNPNTVVTNNDPSHIGKLNHFFDAILVDAPCSGEGMFRKDAGAMEEWSVANVRLCKERQQRILADIWAALKPNGLLLYSTCTYNIEENEENVQWMADKLGAEILPVAINKEWNISNSYTNIPAYHFFPHKTKGEGFFFALLRKNDDSEQRITLRKKEKSNKKVKPDIVPAEYRNYLTNNNLFTYYLKNDSWFAFPTDLYDDLLILKSELNIISEGICLGENKGKDFIPGHSLVMSSHLNREAFTSYGADWKTAISYLRKEALVLNDMPKGYILITYKNNPLGFVKNIGNRANNLYPQEWRIRSNNLPAEIVSVL